MAIQPPVSAAARSAVRAAVCPGCYQHPHEGGLAHAGAIPSGPPYPCEATCPLFADLGVLHALARQELEREPGACEHAVREFVCRECHLSATAGDYCSCYFDRSCPVSRFAARAMEVLEDIPLPAGTSGRVAC